MHVNNKRVKETIDTVAYEVAGRKVFASLATTREELAHNYEPLWSVRPADLGKARNTPAFKNFDSGRAYEAQRDANTLYSRYEAVEDATDAYTITSGHGYIDEEDQDPKRKALRDKLRGQVISRFSASAALFRGAVQVKPNDKTNGTVSYGMSYPKPAASSIKSWTTSALYPQSKVLNPKDTKATDGSKDVSKMAKYSADNLAYLMFLSGQAEENYNHVLDVLRTDALNKTLDIGMQYPESRATSLNSHISPVEELFPSSSKQETEARHRRICEKLHLIGMPKLTNSPECFTRLSKLKELLASGDGGLAARDVTYAEKKIHDFMRKMMNSHVNEQTGALSLGKHAIAVEPAHNDQSRPTDYIMTTRKLPSEKFANVVALILQGYSRIRYTAGTYSTDLDSMVETLRMLLNPQAMQPYRQMMNDICARGEVALNVSELLASSDAATKVLHKHPVGEKLTRGMTTSMLNAPFSQGTNHDLLRAFAAVNDQLVRFRVAATDVTGEDLLDRLISGLSVTRDELREELGNQFADVLHMLEYLCSDVTVAPRMLIAHAYAHFVCQSATLNRDTDFNPVRDADGKLVCPRVNLTNLRCYMESQVRGAYPNTDLSYPSDFSIPANQLTQLMEKRKEIGIREIGSPVNDMGISVTRNGKAFYVSEFSTAEQQPIMETYEQLMVEREFRLSQLGLPPNLKYDEPMLIDYVQNHFAETGVEDEVPSDGIATIDMKPAKLGRAEAMASVEKLMQVSSALAGMQHLPLFVSQAFGYIVYPDDTAKTNYTYYPLAGNGKLSDSALSELRDGKGAEKRQNMMFENLHYLGSEQAPANATTLLQKIALLYATLAHYGEVIDIPTVIALAKKRWEETYDFNWGRMTSIELSLREHSEATSSLPPLPFDDDGNYRPRTVDNTFPTLSVVSPNKVPENMRETAGHAYITDDDRDEIRKHAYALHSILQYAMATRKGLAADDKIASGVSAFLHSIAAKLVNKNTGSLFVSSMDSDPNYYLRAFDPDSNVGLRDDADEAVIKALVPRKRDFNSVKATAGTIGERASKDASFGDFDMGDDSPADDDDSPGSFGSMFDDGDIAEDWALNDTNPYVFFSVYRKTNTQGVLTKYPTQLSLTLVGEAYRVVVEHLFTALRNKASAFHMEFFPSIAMPQLSVDQVTGETSYTTGAPRPMVPYATFFQDLMPTLYASYIFEARPEIGDSFKANTGERMNSNLQTISYDENGEKVVTEFDELVQEFDVPNIKPDTKLIRHQIRTLFTATGDPTNLPPINFLAIAPGGGKTITGIAQALRVIGELAKLGKIARPLIVSPPKLVRNWVDDANKFFGSGVNVYPISSEALRNMPADFIRAQVENAPPNTIFITTYSFLIGREDVAFMLGSNLVRVRANLDYLLSFGFTDVYFDEGHKGKNSSDSVPPATPLAMAAIAQQLGVRVTLATGTMFSKDIKDINGLLRVVDPGLGMDSETFMKVFTESGDAKRVQTSEVLTLRNYMNRMVNYVYVSADEWAFARPKIRYHTHVVNRTIAIDPRQQEAEDAAGKYVFRPDMESDYWKAMKWMTEHGHYGADGEEAFDALLAKDAVFNEAYQLALRKTTDDFMSKITSGDKNDLIDDTFSTDEEEVSDESDEPVEKEKITLEESVINMILIRMIQLVNDPQGDQFNGAQVTGPDGGAKTLNLDEIMSPKMRYAAYLALRHFTDDSGKIKVTNDSIVGRKLVVVGENVRTIMAFQRALPPILRDHCRMFVGSKPTSVNGFNQFMQREIDGLNMREVAGSRSAFESDDNTWILCATEQSLSEGFNLQISNRMIRLDSPWTAGRVKQTKARIDRPDLSGGLARDYADIDWIICDNSLEVLRYARVISRVVEGEIYDNADKPEYAQMQALPKFTMNYEQLTTLNKYDRLRSVSYTYRTANGVEPFNADFTKAIADVYTAEEVVRERQLTADLELATRLNMMREVTRPDGTKVMRPELMAAPRTYTIPGSRPLLFMPTVEYSTNSRLDELGFKTYNLHKMVNDFEISTTEFLGRHVYTQFGFARIVSFYGDSKENETGHVAVNTLLLMYPNGTMGTLPVTSVTLIENVRPENPNLWLLNTMLDVVAYSNRGPGDTSPPNTRILHYGLEPVLDADGKPTGPSKLTCHEVEWDDAVKGFARTVAVNPAETMEYEQTEQLKPLFDDGFERTGAAIRTVAEVRDGDVLELADGLFRVAAALNLPSGNTNAGYSIKLYPINSDGTPVMRGNKPVAPRVMSYNQFALQYGYRVIWPDDPTPMLRTAVAERFQKQEVLKRPVQIWYPKEDFEFDSVVPSKIDKANYELLTISPSDVLRLAAGRRPLDPNLSDLQIKMRLVVRPVIVDGEKIGYPSLVFDLPFRIEGQNGLRKLSVWEAKTDSFSELTQGQVKAIEKIQHAKISDGMDTLPISGDRELRLNIVGNVNAPVGLTVGNNLGNLNKLLEENDGQVPVNAETQIEGVKIAEPPQPSKTPAPVKEEPLRPSAPRGSQAPSGEQSGNAAIKDQAEDEASGDVRADLLQLILGRGQAAGFTVFSPQSAMGNTKITELMQTHPSFDVANGKVVVRADEAGAYKTSAVFRSLPVLLVPARDSNELFALVKDLNEVLGDKIPTRGQCALSNAFMTNPASYMHGLFNASGQVYAHVGHRFDNAAMANLDKALARSQSSHAVVLPAVFRVARINGEQLYLLIRCAPAMANKIKVLAVRKYKIPPTSIRNQNMFLALQANAKGNANALRIGEALFAADLNKVTVRNTLRDLKDLDSGKLNESGAGLRPK